MKPTLEQIDLCKFIKSIIGTWENTNDINSPTHSVDLREFILAELDDYEDRFQEELEETLWDLWALIVNSERYKLNEVEES